MDHTLQNIYDDIAWAIMKTMTIEVSLGTRWNYKSNKLGRRSPTQKITSMIDTPRTYNRGCQPIQTQPHSNSLMTTKVVKMLEGTPAIPSYGWLIGQNFGYSFVQRNAQHFPFLLLISDCQKFWQKVTRQNMMCSKFAGQCPADPMPRITHPRGGGF
jgi:hypothetical protein